MPHSKEELSRRAAATEPVLRSLGAATPEPLRACTLQQENVLLSHSEKLQLEKSPHSNGDSAQLKIKLFFKKRI